MICYENGILVIQSHAGLCLISKVSEIFHYLTDMESDNNKTASIPTSDINKLVDWPEVSSAD